MSRNTENRESTPETKDRFAAEPRRKIKILHIITRMDHGGSADDTVRIIKGVPPEKYESSLLCGSLEQLSETELRELKSSCSSFTIEPSLKRDPKPLSDLRALFRLRRFILNGDYDIVHTHTSKAGIIGRLAARLAGRPVTVHSTHGHVFYGYFGKLKTSLFVFLEKHIATITDRVFCLTEMEIEDHLTLNIGTRGLFSCVYSGVPLEQYATPANPREQTREKLGLPPAALVIGAVARIDPVKGIRHIVEAFKLLHAENPNAHLLLAGDGEDRPELEKLSREYGISDRLHFLGHRTDIADLLHAMDIFALPSLNEGYGKAIVEAFCAGLPVVATRVGGIPALIKDGETGILVPPADPAALANAISRLLNDPALRQQLSAASLRRVSDDLSVEAMIRRHDEIYTELLQSRGKA